MGVKQYCQELKTSDKITFLFTIFNFLSLFVLLLSINIIYFFSWYSQQKADSMYDININYDIYNGKKSESNLQAFKEYILKKDTLIIPKDGGDLICSNGVETRIHNNVEKIKDKLFYNNGKKIFFIFSKYYDDIGEVKVFLDTTPYVKSQILIIKISLIIIFLSLLLYFIIGRKISKYALKNLKKIAFMAKNMDIEKDFKKINIICNKDDEINILASTINKSFLHIKKQTIILKQFITDVSHEFKTPLMIINSQIDLYNKKLEKSKLSELDTSKLLVKIKEKTYKLNSILETFIMFSKIENKVVKLDTKEVFLGDHIRKVVDDYIIFYDKEVNIQYKILSKIKIEIDKLTFGIIFENLLGNAIKFSNNSVEIEIGVDKNSFWIQDNGRGIEKKQLNNIWNKFYRNNINKEGFGVGLFIVKRLVDLYKWNIVVESEIGKGTKFIIKI